MTTSCPAIDALTEEEPKRSRATTAAPIRSSVCSLLSERPAAVTWCPFRSNTGTTRRPMTPVAPVTKIRMSHPAHSASDRPSRCRARSVETGCRNDPHPPNHHCKSDDAANSLAGRGELLDQHEDGDGRNPEQVHHASDKKQRHQQRTAANTKASMSDPHYQRAPVSFAPFRRQESQGRSAM